MKADQTSGTTLVGLGDKKVTLTASGQVSGNPGRVARILTGAGTGTISVYDALSATGNPLWSGVGSATPVVLDCPISTGIYVALGASTTVTVTYA